MKLVIVESPAKAKTIGKILGKEYVVESSIGHVRDLPRKAGDIPAKYKKEKWSRLGVDVENGFEPLYVVASDKKKQITKLKNLLKDADELYLATDEDREGESISWHLLEILKPKVPVKRLAFHEITKDAIEDALKNPRNIDDDLVHAQEARRILDRLYGYEVSPILWRKVAPKLSAGRVQSAALRLIVERERERIKFKSSQYFSVEAEMEKKEKFAAMLKEIEGKSLVSTKDFDPDTGEVKKEKQGKVVMKSKKEWDEVLKDMKGLEYKVADVQEKPTKQYPAAPFITSTLQQEANRKLGFSSRQTMQLAQRLYENGYITYMRTDSINLSKEALGAARSLVESKYGKEYLSPKPRVYKSKVKNAQEAHEAIRPAGKSFQLPSAVSKKVVADQAKLYDLIYRRTLASQMAEAKLLSTVVSITDKSEKYALQANGKVVEFEGFRKVYEEGVVKKSTDDVILPPMKVGDAVDLNKLTLNDHSTKPPARFNEASLVKELEARGVGRPSTYASIIDTILRRNYVQKSGKALVPTFMAFGVIQLLEQHFSHLVDMEFTAEMEEYLDEISRGERGRVEYLKDFYFGGKKYKGLSEMLEQEIDAKAVCTIPIEELDKSGVELRVGRYGPYIEKGDVKASVPEDVRPDELDMTKVEELLEAGENQDESMGIDPETEKPVYKKVGRYGPYVQLGEVEDKERKMKSIPRGVDPGEIDFEKALFLLSLPVDLGGGVTFDIGRYGPYLRGDGKTATVAVESIWDMDLELAKRLLAEGKPARGAAKKVLKEFEGSSIKVLDGRYGPYVNSGKTNVSVPKGTKPEDLTLEECEKMIEEKGGSVKKGKSKKKAASKKKSSAKKKTTKKKK